MARDLASRAGVGANPGPRVRPRVGRYRTAYILILPAVAAMLLVHYLPMLWSFYISVHQVDLYTVTRWMSAPFNGFANFVSGFDPHTTLGARSLRALLNVCLYSVVSITVGYLLGLAAALLLNGRFKGRGLVRSLILLPYITPDSVAYNVWRFILQSRVGILNRYLLAWGLVKEAPIWLIGPPALWSVSAASIWKGWPFACLILLAALQKIPAELYEAARVDGASVWQQFRHLTLPLLKPVTRTLILLSILWNLNAFNQFFVLLGRDPGLEAEVPSTLILREAFTNFNFGVGSAMSIILMALLLGLTIVYIRALKAGAGVEEEG